MSALRSSSAEAIVFLGEIPCADPADIEGEILEHFKAHRVRGEWFEPEPELLAFIAALATPRYDREWELTPAGHVIEALRGHYAASSPPAPLG